MLLSTSLRIKAGEVLALIGAGGKTSTIARLIKELSPSIPVLATTTTHLGFEQRTITDQHVLTTDTEWKQQVEGYLSEGQSVLLTAPANGEGKWTAPSDQDLKDTCHTLRGKQGVLLIEADGARSRALKAPAAHEPVIPPFTTVTVLVAGTRALGKPLSGESVHRPELAGPLMGLKPGETIESRHVAQLLTSPAGGLKGVPAGSVVRCILNIAEQEAWEATSQDLARMLLEEARILSVLLCSLDMSSPTRAVYGRTGCVILAAGGSKRFGRQKLLEPWRGEPLIRLAVQTALQTEASPVVVVTGAEGDRLMEALSGLSVEYVHNPHWREGQSESLRLGLAAVRDRVEAVIFMLGDMPLVESALVEALIEEHRGTLAPVIAPGYNDRPGNPVLFDRSSFDALDAVRGDQGGRAIYDRYPPRLVEWGASASIDIDSLEDLRRLNSDSTGGMS